MFKVNKYCKFAGILTCVTAVIVFLGFVGVAIYNFVGFAGQVAGSAEANLFMTAGLFNLLYAYIAILGGIVLSAILFALSNLVQKQ